MYAKDAKKLIGSKQVRSELERIAACVPLRVRYNSPYDASDYLIELLVAALEQSTAEASCESVSPDSLLRQLDFSLEQLLVMRDNMLGITAERARRLGAFRQPIDLAIDGNALPYFGKVRGPWITGGKPKPGTNWFVTWMCADSVVVGERLTLALEPRTKWSRLPELVERLLDAVAERGIAIRTVLIDREFPSFEVIEVILRSGLRFIAAVKDDPRIKRAKAGLKRSHNNAALIPYELRKGRRRMTVNLALVKRDREVYSWLTNLDGDPRELAKHYSSRWGIETNNRDRKDFRARTTSNRFELRALYYLLSAALLNLWCVLNLLLAARLGIALTQPVLRKYTMKRVYMAELCGADA
jgi:hypothetical protein